MPAWPGTVPPADQLEQTCARVLASGKILADRVPAVTGPNGCGIEAPLLLRAILLQSGRSVAVAPPALMRCDLAEQLADWVRDDIVPITAERGEMLAVADAAAYVCRGRNNVFGAQMSEHGRGDAIDVLAFRFTGGVVGLQQADASSFWSAIKDPTCARFKHCTRARIGWISREQPAYRSRKSSKRVTLLPLGPPLSSRTLARMGEHPGRNGHCANTELPRDLRFRILLKIRGQG